MKFLVAVDNSAEAENTLAYACDFVDAVNGSMTVVHSVDPFVQDMGGSEPISTFADADERLIAESLEDAEQRGLKVLDNAVELAKELGYTVERELLYGDPTVEIPDFAAAEGFDAIYVGHRGRSERAKLLLGSVARGIVERATVPVTVVR